MTTTPIAFDRFGGLNLDDPAEVGAERAMALSNVEIDTGGRLHTRRGYTQMTMSRGYTMFGTGASSDYFIGATVSSTDRATDLYAIGNTGTETFLGIITTSGGGLGDRPRVTGVARVGTGSAAYTYVASYFTDSVLGGRLARTDGSSLTLHATAAPKYVASWQGRLAQGRYINTTNTPSGADGGFSTVFFSSATDPDTYAATDWVKLQPGDGEEIMGMFTWQDQLFVFKETALFVFYGIGTDSTGGAIFNYRKVDLGVALYPHSSVSEFTITAGRDGVYFLGADGHIYRTDGYGPVRVSPPYLSNEFSTAGIWWAGNRLHVKGVSVKLSNNNWLVYDPTTEVWLSWTPLLSRAYDWNVPTATAAILFQTNDGNLYVMDGQEDVWLNPTLAVTDDNGAPITWSWQSGFYDLGYPGNSKRLRRAELWGSGSPTFSVFTDHGTTDANAAAVTLGTAPAVARGFHSKSYRGYLFSHKLSGTTSATVNRVVLQLADMRSR